MWTKSALYKEFFNIDKFSLLNKKRLICGGDLKNRDKETKSPYL